MNLLLAIGIVLLLLVFGMTMRPPRRRAQHLAYRLGPELPALRRGARTSRR